MSVVDLFKGQDEVRAKESLGSDYFYNNRSVYSKNFTSTTYRNISNTFHQTINDEDVKEIRLVNQESKTSYNFDRTMNNRMQRFSFENKLIDYKEITNVEQISGEGYYNLKQLGFNNFYNLYKKNPMLNNREEVLCVLAIKK